MDTLVRRTTILIVVFLAVASWFATAPVSAGEGDFRRVTLTGVNPTRNDKGKWVLQVSGECPRVPQGTRMVFDLTWRSTVVESFEVTIKGANFREEFVLDKATAVVGDEIRVRTAIVKNKQKKDVRNKIEKDEVAFPPGVATYVDHHIGSEFVIGSDEEVAARKGFARKWFTERLEKLIALDGKVLDMHEDVESGAAFTDKEGNFTPAEWHRWFEEDVVQVLVDMQKEIQKKFEELKFRPYLNTLADLLELSASVARRALDKQEKVFRSANVDLADRFRHKDADPDDEDALDSHTQTRRVPRGSYMSRVAKRILDAVGGQLAKREEDGESAPERDRKKK